MKELKEFAKTVTESLNSLFLAAKEKDEFAYVFALLGMNSGMEDAGWQPIAETINILNDITMLANAPLQDYTKVRLMLLLYCQITEASQPYHVLFNMLLAIEGKTPPKVFNFLSQYKNGIPPSVKSKVTLISEKAAELGHNNIKTILDTVFNIQIRNAISHADFILYQDTLRLKHKGNEIKSIPINDIILLINKAIGFFETFFNVLNSHKLSYKDGHVIKGRKSSSGFDLADVTLKVHETYGLYGISTSSPAPLWESIN